jgi:hypothetical protein
VQVDSAVQSHVAPPSLAACAACCSTLERSCSKGEPSRGVSGTSAEPGTGSARPQGQGRRSQAPGPLSHEAMGAEPGTDTVTVAGTVTDSDTGSEAGGSGSRQRQGQGQRTAGSALPPMSCRAETPGAKRWPLESRHPLKSTNVGSRWAAPQVLWAPRGRSPPINHPSDRAGRATLGCQRQTEGR